eukprot:TRINITY_DN7928_c0_g4_i1.p1 TRINITY_DN7928_c0_g4~~TRINITY_DN7928_c0_g4_i1.p1  ORF type:complete len:1105 (+),score=135.09 TRINITY_DN7928_c0_g4_i1:206-3316(+)
MGSCMCAKVFTGKRLRIGTEFTFEFVRDVAPHSFAPAPPWQHGERPLESVSVLAAWSRQEAATWTDFCRVRIARAEAMNVTVDLNPSEAIRCLASNLVLFPATDLQLEWEMVNVAVPVSAREVPCEADSIVYDALDLQRPCGKVDGPVSVQRVVGGAALVQALGEHVQGWLPLRKADGSVCLRPIEEIEADGEHHFELLSCARESLAQQPRGFKRFPLRPDQLRSLKWMLDREAMSTELVTKVVRRWAPGVRLEDQFECKWNPMFTAAWRQHHWQAMESRTGFPWCFETTMRASTSCVGGVLGDAIGSGKTATMIGLLDAQRHELNQSPLPIPDHDKGYFIPSRATLLVVPSNLLGQWEKEFDKFLGPEAFNFIVLRSIRDLREITAERLASCDIVLTTFKIFYSTGYISRLRSFQCTPANKLHERSFMGQPIERTLDEVHRAAKAFLSERPGDAGWTMRTFNASEEATFFKNVKDDQPLSEAQMQRRLRLLGKCTNWRELTFPVLELFYWHRLVFDEFHELEALTPRYRTMLQNLRSHRRWGITGTPPTRDVHQIAELARIMRLTISDLDPIECQTFLAKFVRASKPDMKQIPVEEHVVSVVQTPAERALYLQHAFDGNRKDLLQFCSHHCFDEGAEHVSNASAAETVDCLAKKKREATKRLQGEVASEYRVMNALMRAIGSTDRGDSKAELEAKAKLAAEEKMAHRDRDLDFETFLGGLRAQDANKEPDVLVKSILPLIDKNRPGGDACQRALRTMLGPSRNLSELRGALVAQIGRCASTLRKYLAAVSSSRFLRATVGLLNGNQDECNCSICLESISLDKAALLPCSHCFHEGCIQMVVQAAANEPTCPNCCAPFEARSIVPLAQRTNGAVSGDVLKFGSKLASIAKTIAHIFDSYRNAKVIVFVQWRVLEGKIGDALTGLGITYARLRGPTRQRSRTIEEFQQNEEPRVLIQSLENSASGANLMRASHVLFVHPMDAGSAEKAIAYEMQAIGRIRRVGQLAKKVHIWRFITRDTIEEDISREHSNSLSLSLG